MKWNPPQPSPFTVEWYFTLSVTVENGMHVFTRLDDGEVEFIIKASESTLNSTVKKIRVDGTEFNLIWKP